MSSLERHWTCTALVAFFCLSGCGSATNAPAISPPIAAKPHVIVTFEGANHLCVVALSSEPQGSTVPCAELVPFLKDELRLARGSIYDTRVGANADPADLVKTTQSLNDAGYRFIGGH